MQQRTRVEYPDNRHGDLYIAVILDTEDLEDNVLVVRVVDGPMGAYLDVACRKRTDTWERPDNGEHAHGFSAWPDCANTLIGVLREADLVMAGDQLDRLLHALVLEIVAVSR